MISQCRLPRHGAMLAAHCRFVFELEDSRADERRGCGACADRGSPAEPERDSRFCLHQALIYLIATALQSASTNESFHLPRGRSKWLSSSSSSSIIPHPLGCDPGLLSENCMAKQPGELVQVPASGCAVHVDS